MIEPTMAWLGCKPKINLTISISLLLEVTLISVMSTLFVRWREVETQSDMLVESLKAHGSSGRQKSACCSPLGGVK